MVDQQKQEYDFFYPSRNVLGTKAFSSFLSDYYQNIDYFFFVIKLTSLSDRSRVAASKALLSVGSNLSTEDVRRYEVSAKDEDATLRELQKFSTVLSRNLTNGVVASFQLYFSSIIQEAIARKPELLNASQTIKIEEVMRFRRHSDLVAYLIDKKVNELSYGGIRDMATYFRERLGIEMFDNDEQKNKMALFNEVRNINLHNGGVVNDLFLSRVKPLDGYSFLKGKRALHIGLDQFVGLASNALRVALSIDRSVAEKFKLRRRVHVDWKKR